MGKNDPWHLKARTRRMKTPDKSKKKTPDARSASYANKTSIPGLSHVAARKNAGKPRRFIWTCLFVIGLVLTYSQLSQVITLINSDNLQKQVLP